MIPSQQTLPDFVATLLCDGDARSEFAADPTAALAKAGLQDITAQDVQEVVPLVLAYAPNDGLASLESRLSELPYDPEAAIAHLQAVAQSAIADKFAAPESSTMTAAGDFDSGAFQSGLSGAGNLDGFTGTMASESEFGTLTGDTWGSQESLGGAGTLHGEPGSGAAGINGGLHGVQGAVVADSALGSMIGTADLSADQAAGEFEAAGSEMDFQSQGHTAAAQSGVHGGGSGESALGSISVHGKGGPEGFEFDGSGDPGMSLDGDTLAKGGEFAAGTVASFVSNGGDAFANHISSGGETLGAYLTGAAESASEEISDGSNYMAGHVSSGSDQLAGHIAEAPARAEAATDPSSQEAPDVRAELPADGGLPANGGLPDSGVPAELPNLPVENPLPEPEAPQPSDFGQQLPTQDTVDEGVGHSPVGNPMPQEAPTPNGGDVANDLSMGG